MAPDPYSLLIKPMLAESRETPFDSADHIYELKWDGTRAICFLRDRQRFQNRRMTFIEPRYPDLKVRTKKPAILDGEIVVMWDGQPRGVDCDNAVIGRGREGSIAKRKDARYSPGKRTKDWIKIKKKTTLDCVIAGITAGEGEREDTFGSLIMGAYYQGELFHVGRVGTGFSELFRRSLYPRLVALRQEACPFPEVPEIDAHVGFWTRPEIVAEVHFLEFSKDRHMRAPSFSRLREAKRPEDCVVTF